MSDPDGATANKRSRRRIVLALLVLSAIAAAAAAPRVIALLTPVVDDYGSGQCWMNRDRAMAAMAQLQAHSGDKGPFPIDSEDGFINRDENGITYLLLGSRPVMNNEVVCHSPEPLKRGTPTGFGVVLWCKTIGNGYYWLILKT